VEEKQFITLSAPTSSFQRHAKPFLFYFFGLLFLSTSGCCLDQLAKWSACFWPHSERHSCPLVRKKREEGDAHGDLDDQCIIPEKVPGVCCGGFTLPKLPFHTKLCTGVS
jgi:hypothetical protein